MAGDRGSYLGVFFLSAIQTPDLHLYLCFGSWRVFYDTSGRFLLQLGSESLGLGFLVVLSSQNGSMTV